MHVPDVATTRPSRTSSASAVSDGQLDRPAALAFVAR